MIPQTQPQANNNNIQQQTPLMTPETLKMLKDKIVEEFPTKTGYHATLTENNMITFSTPYGEFKIPDVVVEYYYNLIEQNVEKSGDYEIYNKDINTIIGSKNIAQIMPKEQEIASTISSSQMANVFNVKTNIISMDEVTVEQAKKLFVAYDTQYLGNLSQQDSNMLLKALKKSITYQRILINIYFICNDVKKENK